MIEIVGAPFDLCGPHHGSRLGPSALRLAGLESALRDQLGEGMLKDGGDVIPLSSALPGSRSECDLAGLECFTALQSRVAEVCAAGNVPVVLGGDHSVSIGSVSGAAAGDPDGLALIWVDAHADFNTPDTSPSGNLHGMSVAALSGQAPDRPGTSPWSAELDALWPKLLSLVGDGAVLQRHLAWIGLREVDEGEVRNLRRISGRHIATMQDIDRDGLDDRFDRLTTWLESSGANRVWLSLDVDVLDPIFAPGTGTAVRGGLTFREGHLLAEHFASYFDGGGIRLAGIDLVEVNPLRDTANMTAQTALEWLCSFFGRSILHGWDGRS